MVNLDGPFMCLCNEAGRREATLLRKRAAEVMKVEACDVLRSAAFTINGLGASITIHSDQWFGVDGKSYDKDNDVYVRVQCDDPADGIVALCMFIWDLYLLDGRDPWDCF